MNPYCMQRIVCPLEVPARGEASSLLHLSQLKSWFTKCFGKCSYLKQLDYIRLIEPFELL